MSERFYSYFKPIWAAAGPKRRDRRFLSYMPAAIYSRLRFILFLTAFIYSICLIPAARTLAHDTSCYRLPRSQGELICPPPFGSLLVDINGGINCGPGFCARDSYGKVKCSSVPGGAVDMDANGNVLCVGGCVDGSTSYCVSPRP